MQPPNPFLVASLILISTTCGVRGDKTEETRIAPILLFDGTGTSPGDVAALEAVLNNNQLDYSTVNSSRLNAMTGSQLRKYRLLIVPGGNFIHLAATA